MAAPQLLHSSYIVSNTPLMVTLWPLNSRLGGVNT